MNANRLPCLRWIVVLAGIAIILASVGNLTLAQTTQPRQPLPTGDDGPPFTATMPPDIQIPLPTAVPTRPARVTPTPEPTTPYRPTVAPTEAVLPTVAPSPTQMPAPPTVIPPNPMPDQPGTDSSLPLDPSILGPFQHGTIVNVTRVCPHTLDPYAPTVTLAALRTSCTARPERTLYYEFQFGGSPARFDVDWEGTGAVFHVSPDVGFMEITPMDGFELVAAACATVPPRSQANIVPFQPAPFEETIKIEAKLFKTTYCTWYLYSAQEVAEVMAHVWQCPDGYNLLAAGATPAVDCTIPIDGVRVVIIIDIYADLSYYGDTGADGPGTVTLNAIPPNAYELYVMESMLPAPGGTLAAACDGAPLTTGVMLLPLVPPGASLDCHWYWVPFGP